MPVVTITEATKMDAQTSTQSVSGMMAVKTSADVPQVPDKTNWEAAAQMSLFD